MCSSDLSEIADEDCIRLVTEACEGEFVVVALTGGEPFLRLPLVLRLAAITRALGRLLTVLTNGYWAPQADRAGDVARRLVDTGAFKVTFSWDPSHAHFIPASAIQNGLEACMAAGLHGPCTLCGTILQGPDAAELLRAARLPG